jgi:hypothetical protein
LVTLPKRPREVRRGFVEDPGSIECSCGSALSVGRTVVDIALKEEDVEDASTPSLVKDEPAVSLEARVEGVLGVWRNAGDVTRRRSKL